MTNVDIIGTENVLKYIQATKLTKFCIQRAEGNGSFLPVFECYDSESNSNAVAQFQNWSEFVNQSRPYKISLFNYIELETLANGETKAKKSSHKGNKTEATFILTNNAQQLSTQNQTQHSNNFSGDFASLKADIIREISKNQEENAILNEIKALKDKFAELEEEETDEEEEQAQNNIGGIDTNQLSQIMGLINMFKKPTQPNTINGITITEEEIKNCNTAIKRLFKTTPELDKHLLKLAELSEQKPELYKMLLENLKSL